MSEPIRTYRSRAYEVEAIRWGDTNLAEVRKFLGGIDPPAFTGPGWWFVREGDELMNYVDMDFRADFEPIDPSENKFTWGESVGMSGDVIDIPLNDHTGGWVATLLLDQGGAEVLRDMLNGVLGEAAVS